MATSAKRPSKSTKSSKSSKPTKKVPSPVKAKAKAKPSVKAAVKSPVKSSVKSKSVVKKTYGRDFWLRTRFVFYIVLIAAALMAISLGLMGYNATKSSTSGSTSSSASLFLQSLDTGSDHKAGDTLEVTLYEDSGKQAINALQAAVKYPSEQLEFVSVKTGGAFPQDAATDTATPGLIRVARSIKPGESSLKGAKPVVTIEFKVVADDVDQFELSVDNSASLLVRSSDNKNILATEDGATFKL